MGGGCIPMTPIFNITFNISTFFRYIFAARKVCVCRGTLLAAKPHGYVAFACSLLKLIKTGVKRWNSNKLNVLHGVRLRTSYHLLKHRRYKQLLWCRPFVIYWRNVLICKYRCIDTCFVCQGFMVQVVSPVCVHCIFYKIL